MSFEVTKFQQWQFKLAASSRNHIPTPPTITLDDFPPEGREILRGFYTERDWEYCETCRKSGTECYLMKCAACGIYPVRRTLYCSRKCQREDWQLHREFCSNAAGVTRDVLENGVDMRDFKRAQRQAAKRSRGIRWIITWAFSQVTLQWPSINPRETSLSIYCRSSDHNGKARISPYAYALERMADVPYGKPSESVYLNSPGEEIGVVHLWIDEVLQALEFVDLTSHPFRPFPGALVPQWPWVLAQIMCLQNTHAELAGRRLAPLLAVVTTLTSMGKGEVGRFKPPEDLDNGERWEIYDWEGWVGRFGDVISF